MGKNHASQYANFGSLPSKEEVEKLKTESVRLILNSLNSETDEKKE